MKQKENEMKNEAFFKENSMAFIKLPAQLYKMIEAPNVKDIGTMKFIPKTKTIVFTAKNGLETSEYNLEFMNNDKPTLLFSEVQKPADSQGQKTSEADLELIDFVKYKVNALKGPNEKIEFRENSEPTKRTQKYDQMGIRGRYNNDQITDNEWGRREKATNNVRREKQDRGLIEAKIFELFKHRPRYKFTELQAETNEPKNSLEEVLKTLCETETFEGKKYFILKEIYRFGGASDLNYSGSTPTKKVKKD